MEDNIIKDKILNLYLGTDKDNPLLNYLLGNYNSIIYMTVDKFCYENNVSYEGLASLLKNLGFENFDELKDYIRAVKYEYSDAKGNDYRQRCQNIKDTIDSIANIEHENVLNFKQNAEVDLIQKLVEDILNAPDLIIVGTRASIPLVSYATYILNKVGIRTIKIDSADTNYFDIIPNIDRTTLVLAFGFSRYPKGTVIVLNLLRKKGFKIVSVTDCPQSPLVKFSDYSLMVKTNSYDYTDSYINAMILINTIVILIGKIDSERLQKRLKDFDETAQNLEYSL